ncbi:MAG TPA: hypothetical protein VJ910_11915 [Desulfuromonadales bacterium]|nr:hypothetical protein [Desulfuromonadales bacterium]
MTDDKQKDPIKEHEEIIVNVCEECGTRYSYEEAKQKNMTCCGKPLTQRKERVSTPMGP